MDLLHLSLRGGALILCILLLRLFLQRRLPRTVFGVLWIVAGLRLLLPFAVPLPVPHRAPSFPVPFQLSDPSSQVSADASPLSTTSPATALNGGMSIWYWLWLTGGVLLLTYFAVIYIRHLRIFWTSEPDDTPEIQTWLKAHQLLRIVTVRWCEQITSPLTYGILRPVILLPVMLDRQDSATLQFVLTHEWVHIRRFDALVKLLFAAALTVHWFNPLAWCLLFLGNRDMELSCDAWVIRHLGRDYRAAYALALLGLEEKRAFPCCNLFSGTFLEERIRAIMNYKRYSAPVIFLGVLIIWGIASAFAVQPVTSSQIQIESSTGFDKTTKTESPSVCETDDYETVVRWAETMQERNGEARYSLLADASKAKYHDVLIDGVGVSSPWVTDYNITLDGSTAVITYRTQTSEPETYIYQEVLIIDDENGQPVVRDYSVTVNYLREDLYEEAMEIQEQVLEGHLTWRLNPESVALGFAYETLGMSDVETVSASEQEVVFRTETGETVSVQLYRPLQVEHGFLAVYGYSIGSNHTILDNVAIY